MTTAETAAWAARDGDHTWGEPNPAQRAWSARRRLRDRVFLGLCLFVSGLTLLLLIILLTTIGLQGAKHLDLSFITGKPVSTPADAGMSPAIIGTIMICAVCALTALPLGVGTAILLEEFKPKGRGPRRAHTFVELNIRNLAGVPSIVYGILGLTIFVEMFGLFGTQKDPAFEVNAAYYDQFLDEANQVLRVDVDGLHAPPTYIVEGLRAMYVPDGAPPGTPPRQVTVHLYSAEAVDALRNEEGLPPPGTVIDEVAKEMPAQRVAVRTSPFYLRLPFGRGVLAGGLTLMLVVLPIVIISAQEALRAVPNSLREGALAAGATRWQMVRRMTLPVAIPGIMTGSILAMSRAIGEAAPILVISGIVFILFRPSNLMDDFTAMPLQIYNWAGMPQPEFHKVAATGIIVLLAILLTFNAIAVVIRQKFQKPLH